MQIYHAIFYNHPLTDKKYVVLFFEISSASKRD